MTKPRATVEIKRRQELCQDLYDCCTDDSDNGRALLETLIDDYIYRLTDEECTEYEQVIANQFGLD